MSLTLLLVMAIPCQGVGKSVSQQVAYDIAMTQLQAKGCSLQSVKGKLTLEERRGKPPLYVWRVESVTDSLQSHPLTPPTISHIFHP